MEEASDTSDSGVSSNIDVEEEFENCEDTVVDSGRSILGELIGSGVAEVVVNEIVGETVQLLSEISESVSVDDSESREEADPRALAEEGDAKEELTYGNPVRNEDSGETEDVNEDAGERTGGSVEESIEG